MSNEKKIYVPPTVDDPTTPTPLSIAILAVLVAGIYVVVGTTAAGVLAVAAETAGVVHAGVGIYTNAQS